MAASGKILKMCKYNRDSDSFKEQMCALYFGNNGMSSFNSQSVNITGSTAVSVDKAAQRHKSDGMFSTIVPVPFLTDKGRSKKHNISQTGTLYTCTLMEKPCII
jgi:hypothetical protein